MNWKTHSVMGLGTLILLMCATANAAPVDEAKSLFESVPPPPQTVAAAGAATQVMSSSSESTLGSPAYQTIAAKLKSGLIAASAPAASAGGIDLARMQSDPAYAAQMQAHMQSMSMAEKMAMAQQMSAAHGAGGGAGGSAAVAGFLGSQRPADQSVQAKMRSMLEGALSAAGAQHKTLDSQLSAQAKACPTDKTGWPENTCTEALGKKSIAGHKAIEDAALPQEAKAFAAARALAAAEVAKCPTSDPASASLAAWVGTYTELLRMYGEAMTLRAGFWSHANTSKYTGQVTIYVDNPDKGVVWPLTQPEAARLGL